MYIGAVKKRDLISFEQSQEIPVDNTELYKPLCLGCATLNATRHEACLSLGYILVCLIE